ncbi:glycosyltransferase family 2 protein [Rhodococcus sp. NPDC056960]|uniref:glycosyltransferase family 2 protein n=1 Tax=Rhodococcus sp. NPDC056960 TaxID=3345982 RepID=UPI0036338269
MSESQPRPAFSFLTTAYRTERYLAQSIESVRGQTRTDWELIVVDNGHSDEIARIVRSFASDSRIRLIRQENRGYEGGVSAAAALARGQYFCVLDSDDLLMPDFCARMGAVLTTDRTVDAVGCDAFLFDDDGGASKGYLRSIGIRTRPHPGHRLALTEMLAGYIPYYTGAVRREAWSAVGGYERAAQEVEVDVVMWLRLVESGFDVRMLPERLARCRVRKDSVSRDPAGVEAFEWRIQRSFQTVARSTSRAEDWDALQSNLRRLRYHQAMRRARWSLLEGDSAAARVEAKAAFAQRHTLRAALVACSLAFFPDTMRRLHPVKHRITVALGHTFGRRREPVSRP